MHQHVAVTVLGGPKVGKNTVVAALDGQTFSRAKDRTSFGFKATLAVDALPEATVAVVVIDATNPGKTDDMLCAAKQAASLAAVIITKADLVAREYRTGSPYLKFLGLESTLSYYHDLRCTSLNPTTEVGVQSMMSFIADIVSPPPPPSVDFGCLWARFQCSFLDWMAARFALPVKQHLPDVASDLAAITSDSDVKALEKQPYAIAWEEDLKERLKLDDKGDNSLSMHRITPTLFVKRPSPSERASMEYVRTHTSIPVPRTHHPHLKLLLTDYIEGETLHECWFKLSWFMRFRVACTLRTYVKQLRALKLPIPGQLADGRVRGIFFEEFGAYGPFPTLSMFRRFCEHVSFEGWRVVAAISDGAPKYPLPPRMKGEWDPVFIHGDLNSSNILLDTHGTLWLLDWGYAGFCPPGMESHAMRFVDEFLYRDLPTSWARYRPFIAGATDKEEEEFWYMFFSAIHRFQGSWQ